MKRSNLYVVDTWGRETGHGYRWRTNILKTLPPAKKHIRRKLATSPRLRASLLIVANGAERLVWLSHKEKLWIDDDYFGPGIPHGTVLGLGRLRLTDLNLVRTGGYRHLKRPNE